jgi:hypothetical protein
VPDGSKKSAFVRVNLQTHQFIPVVFLVLGGVQDLFADADICASVFLSVFNGAKIL